MRRRGWAWLAEMHERSLVIRAPDLIIRNAALRPARLGHMKEPAFPPDAGRPKEVRGIVARARHDFSIGFRGTPDAALRELSSHDHFLMDVVRMGSNTRAVVEEVAHIPC